MSRVGYDHVFYISSWCVVHSVFNNDILVTQKISYTKLQTTFAKTRIALASEVRTSVEQLPTAMRVIDSLSIVYGSPWSSFTVFKETLTKQHREAKKFTLQVNALKDYHSLHVIHGARYPRKGDLLAASSHHVGYITKKGFLTDPPLDSYVEAQTVSLIDWVDVELHEQVLAALFPWYLEAPQFLVIGWEGLSVSALLQTQNFDGYILLGARSIVCGRLKEKKLPSTHISMPVNMFKEGVTLTNSSRLKRGIVGKDVLEDYQIAIHNACAEIFPEVAISPQIALIVEPLPPFEKISDYIKHNIAVPGFDPTFNSWSFEQIDDWMESLWHTIK